MAEVPMYVLGGFFVLRGDALVGPDGALRLSRINAKAEWNAPGGLAVPERARMLQHALQCSRRTGGCQGQVRQPSALHVSAKSEIASAEAASFALVHVCTAERSWHGRLLRGACNMRICDAQVGSHS